MYNFEPYIGDIQITHITGIHDGKTEVIGDGKLVVKDGIVIPIKTFNGKTFIEVPKEEPIFINNREIVGITEIRNDDVLQIDADTPLLRIRFVQSTQKTLRQISSDAHVLAKKNKGIPGLSYIGYLIKQLFTYSSAFVRVFTLLALIAVIISGYYLYVFGNEQLKIIEEKQKQIETKEIELTKEMDTLNEKTAQITDFSEIAETYSKSVGYVDVEVSYFNGEEWAVYGDLFSRCTGTADYEADPAYYDDLRSYDTDYYFDLIWYGSGFLTSEDGDILSNRHVMSIKQSLRDELAYYGCDWDNSDFSDLELFTREVIIFPKDNTIYELEEIKFNENYDFATAHIKNFELKDRTPLVLSDDLSNDKPGDSIVTLGYPSGIDFLAYKSSSSDKRSNELYAKLDELSYSDDRMDLLEYVVDEHIINTHITRGIISQITDEAVSFDSSIYGGNSGGPILNSEGKVIGIVTWKWDENETFNLGVASELVLKKMSKVIEDVL